MFIADIEHTKFAVRFLIVEAISTLIQVVEQQQGNTNYVEQEGEENGGEEFEPIWTKTQRAGIWFKELGS